MASMKPPAPDPNSSTTTVCLLYSTEDGENWTEYITGVLAREGIAADRVAVEATGTLTRHPQLRRGRSPCRKPAACPPDVLVFMVTPGLLRAFVDNPSSNFDDLRPVVAETVSRTPSSRDETVTVGDRIILFMCGTSVNDFNKVDLSKRKLADRFVGLDRWPRISHEKYEELPRTVVGLLSRTRRLQNGVVGKKPEAETEAETHSKLFKKLSRAKMNFKMIPTEVKAEDSTMVVLSFDEPVSANKSDGKVNLNVELVDGEDLPPIKINASWLNPQTAFFHVPAHRPGLVSVRVQFRGRDIGTRSLIYASSTSDATVGIVQLLLHQLSQLLQRVVIDRTTPSLEEVDQLLSGIFDVDSPTVDVEPIAFEKFFDAYKFCSYGEQSKVELPTAIHLAAKYGLNELASRLLDLPDARTAYSVTTVDNCYPELLARRNDHRQLADVLENFREVGEGFEKMYVAYVNSAQDPAKPVRTRKPLPPTPNSPDCLGSGDESKLRGDKKGKRDSELCNSDSEYLVMKPQHRPFNTVAICKSKGRSEECLDKSDSDRELYLDMSGFTGKSKQKQPKKRQNVPGCRPLEPNNGLALNVPHSSVNRHQSDVGFLQSDQPSVENKYRTMPRQWKEPAPIADVEAAPSTESATAAAASPAAVTTRSVNSQDELINIMKQVKHNQMTQNDAEVLFQEWQTRHQGHSASFKQKQAQLEKLREEVAQAKESSTFGSLLKSLGIGGKTRKPEVYHNCVPMPLPLQETPAAAAKLKPSAVHSALLTPMTLTVDNRNSTTSNSSSDGVACMGGPAGSVDSVDAPPVPSSLSRNEEEVKRLDCPAAPPVPSRRPAMATLGRSSGFSVPSISVEQNGEGRPSYPVSPNDDVPPPRPIQTADDAAEMTSYGTGEQQVASPPATPGYLQLEAGSDYEDGYEGIYSCTSNRSGFTAESGRRLTGHQMSTPEMPNPPFLGISEERKRSLPTDLHSGASSTSVSLHVQKSLPEIPARSIPPPLPRSRSPIPDPLKRQPGAVSGTTPSAGSDGPSTTVPAAARNGHARADAAPTPPPVAARRNAPQIQPRRG